MSRNAADQGHLSELHSLIEFGDLAKLSPRLSFLHKQNPDIVNIRLDAHAMTLLHLAVGHSGNEIHIIKLLIEHGGDPNNLDCEEKVSPLHLSVLYDFDHVLDFLLRHGGDPSLRDGDGKSCFDHALSLDESDNIRSILLQHISMGSISSIGSEQSAKQNVSDEEDSYMTCQTSASGENEIAETPRTESYFDDDSFVPAGRMRMLRLSTINEETSSLMNKLSRFSGHGHSELCKKSTFTVTELTAINSTCEDSENQDPNVAFTEDPRGISATSTHSMASTPSPLPSPTESAVASLRRKMERANINIPITPTTFHAINKFVSPYTNALVLSHVESVYSLELQAAIQDVSIVDRLHYGDLKVEMAQDSAIHSPKRNGKSYYTYVLLDPRIIKRINLSGDNLKSEVIRNTEKFRKFITGMFYIGKGCGKRPIKHLEDAKLAKVRKEPASNEKIQTILDIWKTGQGPIVHSFFHHVTEREANVYEASMIDAMGLKDISNQKKGSYAGTMAAHWTQKQKNQFGVFCLKTCFSLYAVSYRTIKEIFPEDV